MVPHDEEHAERNPRYQNPAGSYVLPNDDRERERLANLYVAFDDLCQGRLIFVPDLPTPSKILDIGCGIGTVVRRLARTFPSSETIGVDLTVYPPESGEEELKNLSFIEGDINALAGTHPRLMPNSVDFIWARLLVAGIVDWPAYMQRVIATLKPGGWVQMTDMTMDMHFHEETSKRPEGFTPNRDMAWLKALREGGKQHGFDMDVGKNMAGYMKDAGFVDLQTFPLEIPFYKEALQDRPYVKAVMDHSVGDPYALWWHMLPKLVINLGYDKKQVAQWQLDSRRDLAEESGKYMLLWITIGRKPS